MQAPEAPKLEDAPATPNTQGMGTPGMGAQANEPSQADHAAKSDLAVKGRFARYNSPFLQLMIPMLTTRYVWLAIEDINPLNFLGKPDPAKMPGFEPWKKPSFTGYLKRNFAALGMGATVIGLVSFYSKRTADDIKTVYAEAVGYELGKKTEDVTWKDIFVTSENEAVKVTRDAFVKRTGMRLLAGSAFLAPWHMLRDWQKHKPKYDANANAGVGAMGVYLSMFEGFMRKQSFFDLEQNLVGTTLNNEDRTTQDMILPKHIESLLFLQRRHMNPEYKAPTPMSEEGQQQAWLAERVAELMNHTYGNTKCKDGNANFTLGKLNYLIGFGHMNNHPANIAFVELANKSKDMHEVKEAAKQLKEGKDMHSVFAQFGIDTHQLSVKPEAPAQETAPAKFAERLSKKPDLISAGAKGHKDFAEMTTMTTPAR